jgi:hypothetical protein
MLEVFKGDNLLVLEFYEAKYEVEFYTIQTYLLIITLGSNVKITDQRTSY